MVRNPPVIAGLLAAVVVAATGYFVLPNYLFPTSGEVPPTGQVREFEISARSWEFSLKTIEVNAGDTIRLKITGFDDGIGDGHGLAILEFGVDKVIRMGQTVTVDFVANKAGTFTFHCTVFCGSGHSTMTGELVVK